MTIQELRQHQIVVKDPEIDWTEYDAAMGRLRELGEEVWADDTDRARNFICFDTVGNDWWSHGIRRLIQDPLTFDQFMNLEIETE